MYIVIVGCGRVGAELARLLSREGHDVVMVDQKPSAFERLGEGFNGVTIRGSGMAPKTLQDAGIEKTDIFCALTNSDNINIMASQVAKGIFKVPRVIVRVYDPRKAAIYKALGFDILSETSLFASMIRDKIADPMLSSFLIEARELGVLEFPAPAHMIGRRLADIEIPDDCIIAAVRNTNNFANIPDGQTVIKAGDVLLAVVKMAGIPQIKQRLQIQET